MTGRIPLWIDLRDVPVNKRLPYLHAAEEVAAERVLVAKGDPHVDRPGLDPVVLDGHNRLKRLGQNVGRLVVLSDAKAQEKAAKADGLVVVQADDWRVIPLENLLAARRDRPGTLYARARSADEALLFAEVLETGVHGVVLAPPAASVIFDADQKLRAAYRPPRPAAATAQELAEVVLRGSAAGPTVASAAAQPPMAPMAPMAATTSAPALHAPPTGAASPRTPLLGDLGTVGTAAAPAEPRPFLEPANVTSVEPGGSGDRVCLDTTSLLRDGEGLLVGSTARSFALVHAETVETEFVRARPFRVNAGAVHMYLYAPESRTRYLSELRAGEPVLAVHPDGIHRVVTLGRAKVERRPMTLVRWRTSDGEPGMAMLQTAETVRLVRADGGKVAVTDLRPGDQVLVHREAVARHVGLAIDEALEER